MSRFLRCMASAGCFTACIAFGALWVRSYYSHDSLYRWRSGQFTGVSSWNGQITLKVPTPGAYHSTPEKTELRLRRTPTDERVKMLQFLATAAGRLYKDPEILGFGFSKNSMGDHVLIVPHWFFLIAVSCIALAVKAPPRRKFSLRDLLVLMTVAAIAVGVLTLLVRLLPKS